MFKIMKCRSFSDKGSIQQKMIDDFCQDVITDALRPRFRNGLMSALDVNHDHRRH
jgi:hypothetical protein